MKSLFEKAKIEFDLLNENELAIQCNKYVTGNQSTKEMMEAWLSLGIEKLGERRDHLYIHGLTYDEYKKVYENLPDDKELLKRATTHFLRLHEEGKIYENLIPLLEKVNHPSLLLQGKYDPICCEQQRKLFVENSKYGHMIMFNNSSHFPRLEEPERYTKEVLNFVLS